jgi:predicted PurR-regulated permease PerM
MNNIEKQEENGKPDIGTVGLVPPSTGLYLIIAAGLFALIRMFSLLSPIILSFLLVLLISLAVNPLISRMRALTGGRKRSTVLVTVILVLGLVLAGWALFGPMKDSVLTISEALPDYWERLQKPLIKMEQQAVLFEQKLQTEVSTEIAEDDSERERFAKDPQVRLPVPPKAVEEGKSLRTSLTEMLQGVLGSFTAVAFNGAQILVVFVTVFFGVLFTLMNPRPIFSALFSLVPQQHHGQTLIIMQRIGRFIPAWAGGTLLGMVTIGLLVFLLMWPIFGVMDAMVLGLTAGLLEVVPFLGPILSVVPALLLALGQGGMAPLWVILAYIGVQGLENNMVSPFIMARTMKVHPLAVIFSMLLCVAAFGVLGVLIAAPVVAIITIIHEELYRKRFLPTVTDADLDQLARLALQEKQTSGE